jgi:putative tRNA adenosine deaminase-associated protein
MSCFAVVLTRRGDHWLADDVSVVDCESLAEMGDVLGDYGGDVRLLLVEEDDEYAAIVRQDATDDGPRAFLSDGRAADSYPVAGVIAEDLEAVTPHEPDEADEVDVPPVHDSEPLGDAMIVEDLGTPVSALLSMCAHEGTLPVDVLVAVCEKAGCVNQFEDVRG